MTLHDHHHDDTLADHLEQTTRHHRGITTADVHHDLRQLRDDFDNHRASITRWTITGAAAYALLLVGLIWEALR